ncbi:Connector enhancer of kinase suppressor of ras 1 [Oryzias melastigma]|uniref:Connector enhancer of kinase suppressor of ras 1 n=1 Tax=Oryzias melastigma TaxID=30732 RepID=A0A834C0Y4_ORYME|nr:Connector enhancer of kinase suppressor of ras 1 [Oryzias melastigma]
MEPIASWSAHRVAEWLQGLDAPVSQYPISEWNLSGVELLQLTSQDLEKLGVQKIGHQEVILEAVEKLCTLTYGIGGENIRSLTEKLRTVANSLQMDIQSRWRLNGYDGQTSTKLPPSVLQIVVEVITSSKGLFSLLNRHQCSQLYGFSPSNNIFSYCKELGDIVHKDTTVHEKEKDIIPVCRQLVALCDEILNSCPEALLSHTAQLESVDLAPVSPGDQLGIEIASTSSSNHYVTGTAAELSNDQLSKILAGDEVIQVNKQIVVGWSRNNLIKKLKENPNGVSLVLKRIPRSERHAESAQIPTIQKEDEREKSDEEEGVDDEGNPRHSIFERVAASVRSLSFRRAIHGPVVQQQQQQQPMGQEESEVFSDNELERRISETSLQSQQDRLSLPAAKGVFGSFENLRLSPSLRRDRSPSRRSPSPHKLKDFSSCPDMVGHTANKETKKISVKGMTTALSRRRVSCRELDHPDCDGWLWKKKRESSIFTSQKWQRFWFVLKGSSLYWYTSPQDLKAEGLVNVASYTLESGREHGRKYVFQLSHHKFQNFTFAVDDVTDISKWINSIVTAKQNDKKSQRGADREEECYSETESEGESSPSSGRKNKKLQVSTLPRPKKSSRGPLLSSPAEDSKGTSAPVDEMGIMLNNLKEGGVSLIGHEQPITHDHFRRSFIRRSKNPVINEKAHKLRTLKSTLKAREAELELISNILDDSNLTGSRYRQWKEENEELFQEIAKTAAPQTSTAEGDVAPAEVTPTEEVTLETVAKETEGACRLSLSDGEQLVDAELSDVLMEIPEDFTGAEMNPVLELSLGSLKESINKEVGEITKAGEPAEHYFYI